MPSDQLHGLLARGYALHGAGQLERAAHDYQLVLTSAPAHVDALQLLGLLRHQQGRHQEAVNCLERAVRADAAHPSHAGAQLNLGHALKALGRLGQACDAYRAAIAQQGNFAAAHYALGNTLLTLGRAESAVIALREAVRLAPQDAAAHNNLGNALAATGTHAAALDAYRQALALRPGYAGAHNNLGLSLNATGDTDAAINHFERAVTLEPNFVEAAFNLALAYDASGKPALAIPRLQAITERAPQFAAAHYALGNACVNLGHDATAIDHYRRALELDADFALAHQNLGSAYLRLGQSANALAALEKALDLRPELAIARFNRALLRLAAGDYVGGWADYEARFSVFVSPESSVAPTRTPAVTSVDMPLPLPRWSTAAPSTASVRVFHEQGLGDTLQFVRFVPLLAQRVRAVRLEVQPSLRALLQAAALPANVEVIADAGMGVGAGAGAGAHADAGASGGVDNDSRAAASSFVPDYEIALASLPFALGLDRADQLAATELTAPYLQAPAERTARWRKILNHGRDLPHRPIASPHARPGKPSIAKRLGRAGSRLLPKRRRRIGIVWSGSNRAHDARRIALPQLAPLFALEGIDWYLLQPQLGADERRTLAVMQRRYPTLRNLGPALGDFADTAALAAQLDGLISIDTAFAHLAGAMGLPAWLLLSQPADWRWSAATDAVTWYPRLRIIRQTKPGAWQDVIAALAEQLR
ncbi:MAG: tetratricopeptide repeat protein [Janthinobacterium lividum]